MSLRSAFARRLAQTLKETRIKVADKAIERLKRDIRALTRRTRGRRFEAINAERRETLLGWKAYFGIA